MTFGLKAVAMYRDGSKSAQPLNTAPKTARKTPVKDDDDSGKTWESTTEAAWELTAEADDDGDADCITTEELEAARRSPPPGGTALDPPERDAQV